MESRTLKHAAMLQEWESRIMECRSSGKSVAAWCAEAGIKVKTYYYWEKCYLLEHGTDVRNSASGSLMRIEPGKLRSESAGVQKSASTITLTSGKVVLELPANMAADHLAAIVAAINRNV